MATSWVLGKISDALAPTVSSTVSTAGSFAGGAVNAVGSSINGVGEGINNSIRRYGDGAKDYGNSIMDWTKADSARGATASNPLGLSTDTTQGKRSVTSPKVYQAPPKPKATATKTVTTANKAAVPQKKIEGVPAKQPVKKTVPAPTSTTKTVTAKKPVVATSTAPKVAPVKKPVAPAAKGTVGKAPSVATKSVGTVKSNTASMPKKVSSTRKPNYVAASNPLGLSS